VIGNEDSNFIFIPFTNRNLLGLAVLGLCYETGKLQRWFALCSLAPAPPPPPHVTVKAPDRKKVTTQMEPERSSVPTVIYCAPV
jgi:hypothetical protein